MLQLLEPPRKSSAGRPSIVIKRREDAPHLAHDEDARLVMAIRHRFFELGNPQMRQLGVFARNGRVRLTGQLNRYYLLQLAQAAALNTSGVLDVESDVNIIRTPELELMAE